MISSGTMKVQIWKFINQNNLFFRSYFLGLDPSNFSITFANAEVLLETNPNLTEESHKVKFVF